MFSLYRNLEAESPEAIYEKYVTGSKALHQADVVKELFSRYDILFVYTSKIFEDHLRHP